MGYGCHHGFAVERPACPILFTLSGEKLHSIGCCCIYRNIAVFGTHVQVKQLEISGYVLFVIILVEFF